MPKKFRPAGDDWLLKVRTLKVERFAFRLQRFVNKHSFKKFVLVYFCIPFVTNYTWLFAPGSYMFCKTNLVWRAAW
jgi:hypothetical protein